MKKTLSIILSLAMLLSIAGGLNLTAFAKTSGDFTYEVKNGTAVITQYTGSDTELTVPAKIGGYKVTVIGTEAFDANELTSVTLSEGIKTVEYSAFSGCEALKEITIPKSVTELQWFAFPDGEAFKDIYYKDSMVKWNEVSSGIRGSYEEYLENTIVHCSDGDINRKKLSIGLKPVSVSRSAGKLCLKATVLDKGRKVKGKKLTFKFNGKKYTAKTNRDGVARVTVKKSVLKKLKKGSKVTYSATYGKKTIKRTAKVKA